MLFIGGLDAGKSTLARATAAYALRLGRTVAYLDADVSQKTVGPPATVGLKHVREPDDLTLERLAHADALGFVGSTSPQDHLLPLVGAPTRLRERAHADGADLVVVDTERHGERHLGPAGQVLQGRHARARPGGGAAARARNSSPILGVLERFFGIDVVALPVHPRWCPRASSSAWSSASAPWPATSRRDLQRFRVKPTVFMPTLPPLFDLAQLDRLLVGLSDGHGGFTGLGYLEYVPEDDGLRLISPVAEPPKALRLGSVRLEENFRAKRVDLRNLFGTE